MSRRPSWYPANKAVSTASQQQQEPSTLTTTTTTTTTTTGPTPTKVNNNTSPTNAHGFSVKIIIRNIPPNFTEREFGDLMMNKKDPFVTKKCDPFFHPNDNTNSIENKQINTDTQPFSPISIRCWTKQVSFIQFTFKTKHEAYNLFHSMKLLSYNHIPLSFSIFRTSGDTDLMLPHRKAFPFFNQTTTNRLKFDDEAIYSISPQDAAIFCFLMIVLFAPHRAPLGNITDSSSSLSGVNSKSLQKTLNLLDGCACIGGDSIAFAKMPNFSLLYSLLHSSLLVQPVDSSSPSTIISMVESNSEKVTTPNPINSTIHPTNHHQLDLALYPTLPMITTEVTAIEYDKNRYRLLQNNAKTVGLQYYHYDLLDPMNNLQTTSSPIDQNDQPIASPQSSSISHNPILNLIPVGPRGNTTTMTNPITIIRDSFTHVATPQTRNNQSDIYSNTTSNPYSTQIYPQVLFLDPPWGGSDYLHHNYVKLHFGGDSLRLLLVNYIKQQYNGVNKNCDDKNNNNNNNIVADKNAKQKTELIVLKCPTNVDVDDVLLPLMEYRRELYKSYYFHHHLHNITSSSSLSSIHPSTEMKPVDDDGCFIQRVITPKITYLLISIPDYDLSPPPLLPLSSPTITSSITQFTSPNDPFEMLQMILSSKGVTDAQSFHEKQQLLSHLILSQCPSTKHSNTTIDSELDHNQSLDGEPIIASSNQTWIERIVEAWGCSYDNFKGNHYSSPTVSLLKIPKWYQDLHQPIAITNNNMETEIPPLGPQDLNQLIQFTGTLNQDAEINEYYISNTFNCILDTITFRIPIDPVEANTNNVDDSSNEDKKDNHPTPRLHFTLPPPISTIPLTLNYRDNVYRDIKTEYQAVTGRVLKNLENSTVVDPFTSRLGQQSTTAKSKTYTPRSQIRESTISNDNTAHLDQKSGERLKVDVKAFAVKMTQSLLDNNATTGIDDRFAEFYEEDKKSTRVSKVRNGVGHGRHHDDDDDERRYGSRRDHYSRNDERRDNHHDPCREERREERREDNYRGLGDDRRSDDRRSDRSDDRRSDDRRSDRRSEDHYYKDRNRDYDRRSSSRDNSDHRDRNRYDGRRDDRNRYDDHDHHDARDREDRDQRSRTDDLYRRDRRDYRDDKRD